MRTKFLLTMFSLVLFAFCGTSLKAQVAKIGDAEYESLTKALTAAKEMTSDVTVEIYDKVTLNQALTGSYSSIKFVGETENAEIYLDIQGYSEAAGKKVAFEDLKLSKVAGGYVTNAGFMNLAFGVYDVTEATYTNCTFLNGAYASTGNVKFAGCTFYRSHDRYGLWAYGDVDVTVDGCTFADIRGIKMYAEGGAKTVNLTVKNTDFTEAVDKPAIVLTYGESVTLLNNTYSSKGVFELDLDGAPNGTPVTSDFYPTCVNDNGACGVLVDGKIYTTAAQAAAVATKGSNVTLLHDSAETVEFAAGVKLNKNGFEAAGVTVKVEDVAKIGETYYATFAKAYSKAQAGQTIELLADVKLTNKLTIDKAITIDGNGHSIIADETAVWYTVSGKFNTKNYKTHLLSVNASGITLKDIVLDNNNNAAGINVYCAQNVVFDNVSIINATKGQAALTVNGSTVTAKNAFKALGNSVAIDISNGSGVTSALGFIVEEGTVFHLDDKTVKFGSNAVVDDMTNAVAADGKPYFVAKDTAYFYTVAQMESRTTAYSNGLTLLADVALDNDKFEVNGTLNLNECNLTFNILKVSSKLTLAGKGNVKGQFVLTKKVATLIAAEGLNVTTNVDNHYVVYNEVYTVVAVTIPEVEVTDIKSTLTGSDPDLTFALNFKIKDLENIQNDEAYLEALMNSYGNWYTDYVLTVEGLTSESVTFNANGDADGYLAGQYDAWSDSWVSVPFENVEIQNGASLYIMEYAAELMGKSGLRFILQEIAEIVQNFNCGVFFTPEFMAANPDMKVTLDLVVFTENEQGDKTFYNNGPVASNSFDVTNIAAVVSGENKQSQYYDTFAKAYAAAKAGETITLLADMTSSDPVTINKSITLDGNGKTLTYTGSNRAINVDNADSDADLTIKNLTVDCTASYCERGISYNDSGELTLEGVTVKGTNVTYALNLPGSSDNATVTINNSSLTGNIALNVWGENAIITATDSHFTSVDKVTHENYSAIALNNDGSTAAEGTIVYINGGSITAKDENGNRSNAVRNSTNNGEVHISETTVVIGLYSRPVAIVDYGTNQFYSCATLQAAVDKAIETNGSVKLIANAAGAGVVIKESVTIDFNGKTYSLTEGVGSTGTESNGFQILKGNNVTLKNGTLNVAAESAEKFYILVQNYANLNVKDMTLDGTYLDKWSKADGDSYVLSNNSGKVNIINSTITSHNKGALAYAFDVCKYANYEAPVVTLDETSEINGKVELSGGQFYPAKAVTVSMTKAVESYQVADNNEELESGWYTISAPFAVKPTLTEGYELFRYNEAEAMWENHKNSEHNSFGLEVGRGYLYAHAKGADLNLVGEVNIVEKYSTTLSYTANEGHELEGFHLLGNPYTFSISGNHFSGDVADGFYTLANSGAWLPKTKADEITVGEGFLVQAEAETAFAINKTATATRNADNGSLQINVANAKYSDVAYVSFNEGIGLSKVSHQNANIPMVYVPVEGENYSIAYMSADVEEIPFAFEAKTMGSYTISVEAQNCEFETMTLVDRFTGVETNLLFEDYSFIAKSGDNSDRFIIRLSNETLNLEDENFVYINNNGLIIDNASSNATLQIFDVMGRPVASYNLSGSANISMESLTNGVYILRLMDENNVRVQKVVID